MNFALIAFYINEAKKSLARKNSRKSIPFLVVVIVRTQYICETAVNRIKARANKKQRPAHFIVFNDL